MDYKEKVVLITGTSRGIGLELTKYFLRNNAIVLGVSRGKSIIKNLNYTHIAGDISDTSSIHKIFDEIRNYTDKIDILINNAGVSSMNSLALMPKSSIAKITNINLLGSIYMTQECIKIMSKNKKGRIINFTSIAVPFHIEGEAIYSASKAAIEEFSRTVSKEIFPFGITINNIGPSLINTKLLNNISDHSLKKIFDLLCLKKYLEYDDIYNIIDFYCREESKNITGQTLYLGGAF